MDTDTLSLEFSHAGVALLTTGTPGCLLLFSLCSWCLGKHYNIVLIVNLLSTVF